MAVEHENDIRAPWARATILLRSRVDNWLAADPGRTMNGLARNMGYASPNGLRKALAPDHGPRLEVLLRLAGVLGYRSIEELFGDFGTTALIEELRPSEGDENGSEET
jgi:hypothetical protein